MDLGSKSELQSPPGNFLPKIISNKMRNFATVAGHAILVKDKYKRIKKTKKFSKIIDKIKT